MDTEQSNLEIMDIIDRPRKKYRGGRGRQRVKPKYKIAILEFRSMGASYEKIRELIKIKFKDDPEYLEDKFNPGRPLITSICNNPEFY